MELVGLLPLLSLREIGLLVQIDLHVSSGALDEEFGYSSPDGIVLRSGHVLGKLQEVLVQESQELPECTLFAAVRSRGKEDHVPVRIIGQGSNQLHALVPSAGASHCAGAGMRFIHDDHLRAASEEIVPPAVGLDVIQGDDSEGVMLEERTVLGDVPLKPPGGAGKNQFRVDMELVLQLPLPLLGELGGAQDGKTVDLPPVQHLPGDETALNGFSDSYVIRDEDANRVLPQRHEKRNELVGPWLNRDTAETPERTCSAS